MKAYIDMQTGQFGSVFGVEIVEMEDEVLKAWEDSRLWLAKNDDDGAKTEFRQHILKYGADHGESLDLILDPPEFRDERG